MTRNKNTTGRVPSIKKLPSFGSNHSLEEVSRAPVAVKIFLTLLVRSFQSIYLSTHWVHLSISLMKRPLIGGA